MLTRSHRNSANTRDFSVNPAPQELPPDASDTPSVTWIGHTSFLVQFGGMNILTDPIWSNRASPVGFAGPKRLMPPGIALDALPGIDATVLSHDHYDHLDDRTVRRLIARFPEMTWLTPLGVGDFLRKRGAVSVRELDWWARTIVGSASFACTPAQHFSGRFPWNRNATLWCGWAIRIGDTAVFFAGDTGLHPEWREIAQRFGPFDVSILPIGAYDPRWFMHAVHMAPEEAVLAFQAIDSVHPGRAGVMVASHWGTFRLTDEPIDEPPRVARRTWATAQLPPENLWILAHGESRALQRPG
jgi:N-acyl-phosphatidylethanolamine-hydrolysing phospholipase D